jgi:hypothetical protein
VLGNVLRVKGIQKKYKPSHYHTVFNLFGNQIHDTYHIREITSRTGVTNVQMDRTTNEWSFICDLPFHPLTVARFFKRNILLDFNHRFLGN